MGRLTNRQGTRRDGITVIEMAIIFPILLLITIGLIEYGWIFLKYQQVTNAARQGARVGARADATNTEVDDAIDTIMAAAGIASGDYSVVIAPIDVTTPEPGEPLTVTVTVPYANVQLTGGVLVPVPTNLQSAVTMAKEGP
jgi:Flp pilus assembly protein TadG